MLTTEELHLACVLGEADAFCYIQAIAQAAELKVLVIGRDEVAEHVGRALTDDEWWDLSESKAWNIDLEGHVSAAPFIDQALAASNAVAADPSGPPT